MFETCAAVWALTDDRAGHNAHTLGLAKALGLEFEEKKLSFNAKSVLPDALQGANLSTLSASSRALLSAPWPSLIIASGRRMAPLARYIKAKSPKTKWVQCLWPGRLEPFDVIVAPTHDALPPDTRIIHYTGALHALGAQVMKDASLTFHALFDKLPAPQYGVLIGGHSGRKKASRESLHHLIDTAEFLVGDGSLMLTTSRRSPKGFGEAIRDRLTCEYYLHDWRVGGANPYLAMLARCEALIVSGDSISMMSEACTTGKPVLIDTRFESMRAKHHRAASKLIEAGHAFALRADLDVSSLQPTALNEMPRLAKEVKLRLHITETIG